MANVEDIRKETVDILRERYPGAKIETEPGAPGKIVIHIIWNDFRSMNEEARQDSAWELLHRKFEYSDLKHIGFIMTWTPEELDFYEQEYGEAITEPSASK